MFWNIRSSADQMALNNQAMLGEFPKFLESLGPQEKIIFQEIVENSEKKGRFQSTKEERMHKKLVAKELSAFSNKEDLVVELSEQIGSLHLTPPFDKYINFLGIEKFQKFLSSAELFKNQYDSISNIEEAVEKASRVVFALRSYLDTSNSLQAKEVDLQAEIDKCLKVYDNFLNGKIQITKDIPHKWKYFSVTENMQMVWKNLIFNAIQAMHETEKRLKIKVEKWEKIPEELKNYKSTNKDQDSLWGSPRDQGWIAVRIKDSGVGIPLDIQDNVFNPFVTTRPVGEGIGLGLFTSKKVVQEHGGEIFFKSETGSTEFVVAIAVRSGSTSSVF